MSGDDFPIGEFGELPLTVKQKFVESNNLWNIREKYFAVSSGRELSESIDSHTIIRFINETHFIVNVM